MITPPAKKSYNHHLVLDLPPLPLEAGHITAVIGANGSGKTTFARLLAGIIPSDTQARLLPAGTRVGYLPQHPYTFHMRVQKNILLSKADRERCQQLMAALQIQHLAKQQAPKLSGGETARMALARLLMQSFDLLILDEPTASMDIASTILAETLIRDYCKRQGCPVVMISHGLGQVQRIADDVLVLHEGCLAEMGPASQVLNAPTDPRTQQFLAFYRG